MRLGEKATIGKRVVLATLERGDDKYPLIIVAPRISFYAMANSHGITLKDQPPMRPLMDDKGVIVRHPVTKEAQFYPDSDDPAYRDKFAVAARRLAAMKLREVLREDPNVNFDTVQPSETEDDAVWQAYADALLKEIEECGITEREMYEIGSQGDSAGSGLKVGEAAKAF